MAGPVGPPIRLGNRPALANGCPQRNTLCPVTGARSFRWNLRGSDPYAPPALSTGTRALYDTPTSTARLPSAPVERGMTQDGEPDGVCGKGHPDTARDDSGERRPH